MIFDIAMRQPIAFEQRQQKMNLKKNPTHGNDCTCNDSKEQYKYS